MSTDARDAKFLDAIADELPVGVCVARIPGGEIVYANPAYAEIMGREARLDVATGLRSRTGEPYPEDRMPHVRAVAERTTVVADDIVVHRPDGRKVHVRATARPVFDGPENISHVVVAFIDITREVEAEARQKESEARLARAQRLESIGQLAGGIAHDFHNLLASIKLFASTLRQGEVDPVRRADLEAIEEVAESGAQLTRNLLGFARQGKNRAERVSLTDVVHRVATILLRTFDRRIEIALRLAPEGADVIGDSAQLEQVVMNLAMNARDAMPEGGRLTLRTRVEGDKAILEVADTGCGIPPELRERIFEPYFTTKTSGPNRGTGLGLATVWGIIETHRGTIDVQPNQPRGTVMRIELPRAPADAPTRSDSSRPARTPPRTGTGTVLVVEDEPLVRAASARALEVLGYRVLTAGDGVEALDVFAHEAEAIDVVVLDLIMPRMDGRQTYLAMRRLRPDVAVLLTTGFALNDEAQAVLDLGVREFLAKPYDLETLGEAVARLVSA